MLPAATSDTATPGKTAKLNTEQQDALDAFMQSTGLDDEHAACAFLHDSGWQLGARLTTPTEADWEYTASLTLPVPVRPVTDTSVTLWTVVRCGHGVPRPRPLKVGVCICIIGLYQDQKRRAFKWRKPLL